MSTSSIDPSPFVAVAGGLRVRVHAKPGARRDALEGLRAEVGGGVALKVTVRAAPEGGKANAAIVKLLAGEWKLPRESFRLVAGGGDRRKTFHIEGEPRVLLARLENWRKERS